MEMYDIIKSNAEKCSFFAFSKKFLLKIKKISETMQPNEKFVVYIGVGHFGPRRKNARR
jgi:hypothetical protein